MKSTVFNSRNDKYHIKMIPCFVCIVWRMETFTIYHLSQCVNKGRF